MPQSAESFNSTSLKLCRFVILNFQRPISIHFFKIYFYFGFDPFQRLELLSAPFHLALCLWPLHSCQLTAIAWSTMPLDPLSALSVAASAIQFIDFSSKIVSKGKHIYKSANGVLREDAEVENLRRGCRP
jgi:hypothetical protein